MELRAKRKQPAKRITKLVLGAALGTLLFSPSISAQAQQPGKAYRIGYLAAGPINESFRQRLRELGYIEGKNLLIEYRFAKSADQYPDLANDVVRLRVDLILAVGVAATRAAKNATGAIPIVMGNASDDPVRQGLVASLARPGGNVTGVIDMLPDLAGKRLELLKETFPRLFELAISFNVAVGMDQFKLILKRLRLPPDRWECKFKLCKCQVLMIWRMHSKPRPKAVQKLSS